ncbi:MAG: hypothetical protein HQL61_07855 [Magnetococcales bacterium]|nr:hypothetical protein [Nitrospirota bacterium]
MAEANKPKYTPGKYRDNSSNNGGDVAVKGYTRDDGTVVKGYTRSRPS